MFNCNAPDTGNMEVLLRYGTPEQKKQWLEPLLDGAIRSAFCMTEPDVASSDATNMAATAILDGDEVVINGRKWWSTGVGHPDCELLIFMGLTDPEAHRYARHTMVLVPRDTPRREGRAPAPRDEPVRRAARPRRGVVHRRPRAWRATSWSDRAAPSRSRRAGSDPGRVHHCMRLIGLAEKSLELALQRGTSRTAFGKPLVNLGGNRERIADARIAINQARLLVLQTAYLLDTKGLAGALSEVSQIKVAVPRMAQDVIDMAIQLHGGGGLSDDFPLAAAWTSARALRLADGPDEVHRGVVAKIELAPYQRGQSSAGGVEVSRVLVTGGASGLGAALVAQFVAEGHQVLSTDLVGGVVRDRTGRRTGSSNVRSRGATGTRRSRGVRRTGVGSTSW